MENRMNMSQKAKKLGELAGSDSCNLLRPEGVGYIGLVFLIQMSYTPIRYIKTAREESK